MSQVSLTTSELFTLPDCLGGWPFKRAINPAYESVALATKNWVHSFKDASPVAFATAEKTNGPLVAALMYPLASPEHFRIIADLMDLYFIYDDITDRLEADPVRKLTERVVSVLSSPEKDGYGDDDFLVRMFHSFGKRLHVTASPIILRRFLTHFNDYSTAVCVEAEDRDESRLRDFESYMAVRRGTIGTHPCYDLLLLSSTDSLPRPVLEDARIVELEQLATGIVILINDSLSYNVEQARGEDLHNAISIIMRDKHLSVQGSMDHAEELSKTFTNRFLGLMAELPWQHDRAVMAYVRGLGTWVTGLYEWSFEIERYQLGPQEKSTRRVQLLPRN